MPKITLNMIVRNEAHVIKRCLDSVKSIIDSYYIVDTGSQDDTVGIIQGELKNLPGHVVRSAWTGHFHIHRNEALEGVNPNDYALIMDADDELEVSPYFNKCLTERAYAIAHSTSKHCNNYRVILFRPSGLKWKGARHERLIGEGAKIAKVLPTLSVKVNNDGARNQTDKFQDDISVLLEVIGSGNFDEMDIFNLAQSYKDAGHYKKAIETYQRFIHYYGGEQIRELRCFASIICGSMEEQGDDIKTQEYLERAIAIDPTRIEPYVFLAQNFMKHGKLDQAVKVSEKAISLPRTFHYLNEMVDLWDTGRFKVYDEAVSKKRMHAQT